MHELFKGKYRISTARLKEWDYAKAGMYFITICTENKKKYFGKIVDRNMQLSELGEIAQSEWVKSVKIRPDMNIELGEFIVMPDHFHAIIIIGDNQFNNVTARDATPGVSIHSEMNNCGQNDGNENFVNGNKNSGMNDVDKKAILNSQSEFIIKDHFGGDARRGVCTAKSKQGPQSNNLSSVIRGYKSAVTMYARKNNIPFGWQSRFHDHVIRSHAEYGRISDYIINNPSNWKG